ncbi:hypothetical protein DFH11DRAFT_1558255 [Phellopilus nigrolimitatus]|nr:hypothetical protein DFH11DRAFT_1558255 [Phellopilus nigrolimitatus]
MSNAGLASATKPPTDTSRQPLIPESIVDAPSQRLYILSLGLLCQAIKIFDWLHSLVLADHTTNLTLKWVLVDIGFCLVLKRLRIPRLNYAAAAVILQIVSLCLMDGVLFGSVQVGVSSYSLSSSARDFYRKEMSTSGRMINLRDLFVGDEHLKGEHTVRMSPISTAKLNPGGHTYCLSPPANMILIPVLLNNTKPSHIRYSVSIPGTEKVDYVDLNARELRNIEQQRLEALKLTKASASADSEENSDDDWDDEDEDLAEGNNYLIGPSSQELEKTQSVVHLKVTKPGTVRLERVLDSTTTNMARIFFGEVSVVPCPQAEFVPDSIVKGNGIRCMGSKEELAIKVFGVPPLSLKWHKEINGRREYFAVDRIEGMPNRQGQAHELRIPLDMPLDIAGLHEYVLDSLSDGLGNLRTLAPNPAARTTDASLRLSKETIRLVTVLRRAAVSFRDCAPGKPSSLLIGSETSLVIAAKEFDPEDGPWDVTVQYQPGQGAGANKKASKPWLKSMTLPAGKSQFSLTASGPGEYSVVGVKGQHCPGDVLSPESCRVIQQPFPTAEIDWRRIHECSGDTGVSAYLVLHGKPPFQVFYQQKRNSEPIKEMSRTFQGSRGEITLQPESSGDYTYTFVSLSDANYKRIKLDGPSINQVVHPLASASFVFNGASGVGSRRSINSCSGSAVDVEVDLRGDGPWNLEVQIVGPKGSEMLQMKDLKKSREKLKVPIPSAIDEEGGMFQVDLVSVEDSYKCRKDLAVPGMSVNVRRVKPNVRFYTKDGKRKMIILENQEARLPLRLTGEGPWKVKYELANSSSLPRTAVLSAPNDFLIVNKNGVYRLLEITDSQCPGTVIEAEADYTVDWTSRPAVKLSPNTDVKYMKYNGSFIRAPVCEGKEDHVDLEMTGRPPFQIGYNIARNSEAGGTRILDSPVISSIQSQTRIQLLTSQAGRIYYEIKHIGDSNYPVSQNRHHVIPRNERLLFEQEVVGRPSAEFKKLTRLTHCLRDTFVPSESYSTDDMIILDGRPPFHLELSVKNLAASEVHRQTVELWETQWRVNLPNYVFNSIGPHLVTIESVRDASSCKQAITDPLKTSIWVDVAESAAIVPFDRREHFCVGDITQFQLEGIPPWTIGYKSNRKQHEQVAKQSPFALVQQHAGEFSITSISHQQQMCKTAVDNINFEVHALPSAQVAAGREYFENIHEGSQAQIIFTLVGEPPFTFTYQRSEVPTRKGAKQSKVLETHTVSGVMSHDYSIYSALEGTWTVTFISDKYCRYPPAQPDGLADKNKG